MTNNNGASSTDQPPVATKGRGRCFPRRHMHPAVDSFYWFAFNRYQKIGVFRRDDRAFAEDYGVDKSTITRWIRFLETEGWLVPRRTGAARLRRNRETGMFESIPYDVVSHDDWAASHPDTCRYLGSEEDPKACHVDRKRPRLTKKKANPANTACKTQTGPVDLLP